MREGGKTVGSDMRGPDPALLYPVRAEVDTFEQDGLIVLEYPKDFNRFERFLHRFLGGPTTIKRPLDDVGSFLWEMSDGTHSLLEIYKAEQGRFHERVEPLDKIVGGLLEILLKLGLMRLELRSRCGGKKGR